MSQTLTIIIGSIAGYLTLILFLFPQIIRWMMRPKIEMKTILGDLHKVKAWGETLFTSRKVTLWIYNKCDRPLTLESITFRRICRFQKQCLLFRYLQKTKAILNKDWCPCSSVTDWDFSGFEENMAKRKEEVLATFASEGKLKLTPVHKIIPKRKWREFEVPFKLRVVKSHIVEVTLSFNINFQDMPLFLKILRKVVNPISKEKDYTHSLTKNITVDLRANQGPEPTLTKGKEQVRDEFRVLYPYFSDSTKFETRLRNLRTDLMDFFRKDHVPSEMSAEDLRKTIKEAFPETDIVYSLPPNGKYHVPTKQQMEEIMKVWSSFRKICRDFLDCEQYATLFSLFGKKLIHPFLPGLMKCTYEYLMLSTHDFLADLKMNLSKRTDLLPLALPKVTVNELKSLIYIRRKKSSLKRITDDIARLEGKVKRRV